MESVGDILDRMDGIEPQPKPKVEPFVPATLADAPKLPPPGIYFSMPEDVYHALPALSSGGVKTILASPMQYWANATWLSETARKREKRERENPKTQVTRIVGRAYHCRLLEGASEFALRFARDLAPEDCEDALVTTEQIKAAISNHKVVVVNAATGERKEVAARPVAKVADQLPDGQAYMRTAKKEDWIEQLLGLDPNARILDVLQREHLAEHDGKHFLSADAWEQIEIAAKMVEADPECQHAFKGGYPEVTLIWYCAETGVPMKARVDRLKLQVAVDLKSIASDGRSLDLALCKAIAAYKYNIQPSVYLEGIQAVKALVRELGWKAVHTPEWEASQQPERDICIDVGPCHWAEKWAKVADEPKWLWIFQQKNIPVTRGVVYPTRGMTRQITDDLVRSAKRLFRQCSETYGLDYWLDVKPITELSDEDIPTWSTDI